LGHDFVAARVVHIRHERRGESLVRRLEIALHFQRRLAHHRERGQLVGELQLRRHFLFRHRRPVDAVVQRIRVVLDARRAARFCCASIGSESRSFKRSLVSRSYSSFLFFFARSTSFTCFVTV